MFITVEDDGVFTMRWSATITYRRAERNFCDERVCAENIEQYYFSHRYYSDKNAKIPTADKPDF